MGKRGSTCRDLGSQHSRSCLGCAAFIGQVEDRGAGLSVETQMRLMSHDRTEIRSDPAPETEPTTVPESTQEPHSPANIAPICNSDSTPPTCQQEDDGAKQRLMIGMMSAAKTEHE